jgi:CTP synthase
MWTGAPNLSKWQKVVQVAKTAREGVRIAVVGKYVDLADSYKSLNEALAHGGFANECRVELSFVDSEKIVSEGLPDTLTSADAVLVPMGFGPRGTEGKIAAVRYAREEKVPFFGICFGMQMAVIEYARNVCGLGDANSSEVDERTPHPVIHLMQSQATVTRKGGTMRLGAYPCSLSEHSLAARLYGKRKISERHRHRYEFNNAYRDQLTKAGLILSGVSPTNRWWRSSSSRITRGSSAASSTPSSSRGRSTASLFKASSRAQQRAANAKTPLCDARRPTARREAHKTRC